MKVHVITQTLARDYGDLPNNFSIVQRQTEVDLDSTQAFEAIATMYGAKIYERNGKHFFTARLDTQRMIYSEYTITE